MSKYDKYKESAFTHEEMQPMVIETDMTDIVERLLLKKTLETVEDVHVLFADAADEIERLREALRSIACSDDTCECGYIEGEGPFCELGRARAALGEKE